MLDVIDRKGAKNLEKMQKKGKEQGRNINRRQMVHMQGG